MTLRTAPAALLALITWVATAQAQMPMDRQLAVQALKHTDYGLRHLRAGQAADGSWSDSVHVTGLALHAFLRSYRGYAEDDGAFITRPVAYLIAHAAPDGSISTADGEPVRDTAAAMLALKATNNPRHDDLLRRAQAYLAGAQASEASGTARSDPRYGAFLVTRPGTPDLATQYLALHALSETGLDPESPVWDRALVFLSRLQGHTATPGRAGAGDAGSFAATPGGEPLATGHSATALTYAGLAGLLAAGAPLEGPRVAAARGWITRNYGRGGALGPGEPADYFLYEAAAAALVRLGEPRVKDFQGKPRNWRDDLVSELLARYNPDGSWGDGGGDRSLATAHSVNALNRIVHSLR